MKYVKFSLLVILFVFLLSNCSKNKENSSPLTPNSPHGLIIGFPNHAHVFQTSTIDPDGDDISYQFDWGDGSISPWSDYASSGDTVSMSCTYLGKGIFAVRVHAQDEMEETSGWSEPFNLIIGFPDSVVDSMSTGQAPNDLEVLPSGQYIYVANILDDNVYVFSGSDNSFIKEIPVGDIPRSITALPNSQYVYVMCGGGHGDAVIRIQTSDNTVTDTILIPDPWDATVLPNGEYLYVTSPLGCKVYVIRTSDNTVIDSVEMIFPRSIESLHNGEYIYVSAGFAIYTIRTSDNTITDSINGDYSYMSVSPDGRYLYVSRESTNHIYVVRTSDNIIIDTVEVGDISDPDGIGLCVHPSGQLVYGVNEPDNIVSVIHTLDNTVIKTMTTGNGPSLIAPSPNGEYIYILHNASNIIYVLGYSF